jgi:hypothetical protein
VGGEVTNHVTTLPLGDVIRDSAVQLGLTAGGRGLTKRWLGHERASHTREGVTARLPPSIKDDVMDALDEERG